MAEQTDTGQARESQARRPAGGGSHARPPEPTQHTSFWRELPLLLVVALGLAFLVKTFLVQAFYIPSGSMQQTLEIGDRVLVNKVVFKVRDIERVGTLALDTSSRASVRDVPALDHDTTLFDLSPLAADEFGPDPEVSRDLTHHRRDAGLSDG